MDNVAGKDDAPKEESITTPASNKTLTASDVKSEETSVVTDLVAVKKENGIQLKTESTEIPLKSVDLTVFVGKVSERVTPEELKTFFIQETKSTDEEVVAVNMPWKVVKKSKKLGIAFVDFSNKRAYEAALTLNNAHLHGQNILVLPASSTHQGLLLMDGPDGEVKEGLDGGPNKEKTNYVPVYKKSDHVAYIKNLPNGVSEEEVLEFFKFKKEEIVDIAIPIPFKAKRSAKRPVRAIIAFPTEEALEKCLAQTKTMFRDREVIVERHQMVSKVVVGEKRPASDAKDDKDSSVSPEKQPHTSGSEATGQMELDLFVKHIPREASDRQIKDFFASVGAIVTKVNLFSESVTGSTRGMGFVSMADKESVQKGLALDCKRFYKNKVRVSVRRDREHLERPDESKILPNFSTFIGNLPIKEKAETLKQVLTKHFESAKCTFKALHIPLASNRSGNKGYAFIVFGDEATLKKGQDLNNSEVKLPNNTVTITVSDRWPENPAESTVADKAKLVTQRGPRNMLEDTSRLNKRKKGLPPGGPMGPPGPYGPMGPGDRMGPPNRWNCPPDYQPEGPDYGPYGPEYQDYLDYLAYRDYVAMRKAYDERRELAEYRARYRAEREEEMQQQPSLMELPHPPPPSAPSSQGPMGSGGYSRPLGGMNKEGHLDDGYRGSSSFSSSGRRDRGGYEDNHPSAPHGGSRSRDYQDFEYAGSRGREESGFPNPSLGGSTGGYGGGNMGGGSGGGSGGASYLASEQRASGNYNFSDSFSSSLNSSRYQSAADSTFSRSRLLDNSVASSNALGYSRDPANGLDSSNRGAGVSNYNAGYVAGGGGDARSSHSAGSGGPGASNLRSSTLDSGRSQYGHMSYSGLDRGMGENSGFGSTGGSYSGAEVSQRYSYAANAMPALAGDRSRFSGYPMSAADSLEQYRKGSQYDKADSNVSRLGSSGIASNSGYDGYSGMSGYRAA